MLFWLSTICGCAGPGRYRQGRIDTRLQRSRLAPAGTDATSPRRPERLLALIELETGVVANLRRRTVANPPREIPDLEPDRGGEARLAADREEHHPRLVVTVEPAQGAGTVKPAVDHIGPNALDQRSIGSAAKEAGNEDRPTAASESLMDALPAFMRSRTLVATTSQT